jgi:hypothetical protein
MNTQNTFEPVEFFCPNCGEKVNYSTTLCPNCNSILSRFDEKLSKELIQGQTLTRIILISSFCVILIANILGIIIPNLRTSTQAFITLVLTALLFIFCYKGFAIAKWITIIFFGITGLTGIKLGISLMSKTWFALIIIVLAAIYVGFSVLLIKSKPIKYFQEYQKIKRKMSK